MLSLSYYRRIFWKPCRHGFFSVCLQLNQYENPKIVSIDPHLPCLIMSIWISMYWVNHFNRAYFFKSFPVLYGKSSDYKKNPCNFPQVLPEWEWVFLEVYVDGMHTILCCTVYMQPCDVWCCLYFNFEGIVLFFQVELATGEFPYKNCKTDFEVLTKVLEEDPPLLPPGSGFSREFCTFVMDWWVNDNFVLWFFIQ